MPTISGRNVKVEIALTLADPLAITGITRDLPAVVTHAGAALAAGLVGFFSVTGSGMIQLNEQAVLVGDPADGTFKLPGLDTSDYDLHANEGTSFIAAASWSTLAEAAAYAVGGGAATQLDDTRLHESKARNVAGNLASQDLTLDVRNQEVSGAAMQYIEGRAQRGLPVLIKISKNSKVLRVAYGVPSLPGEQVGVNALATGQISVTVAGWCLKPNV